MREDVAEAIESARTSGKATEGQLTRSVELQRHHSFGAVRALVLAVVQELPSEMTMAELCDELTIANNQGGRRGA